MDGLFPVVVDLELQRAGHGRWQVDEQEAYCHRCGACHGPYAAVESGCPACPAAAPRWRRLVRLGPYREPLSRWILALKFAGQWTWAPWLGRQLGQVVPPASGPVVVCPVPMHWWRRSRRGFNQAALIVQAMAAVHGWPQVNLLRRTRYTQPQTRVPVTSRLTNIRGSVAIRPVDLRGWTVWLVDDVKTTGATLSTCSRLLQASGATQVNVAVVAVAEVPWRPRSHRSGAGRVAGSVPKLPSEVGGSA